MKYICKTCYRIFDKPEAMMQNAASETTSICRTCNEIVGKGSGYKSFMSDEEANKWFDGIEDRKIEVKTLEEELDKMVETEVDSIIEDATDDGLSIDEDDNGNQLFM